MERLQRKRPEPGPRNKKMKFENARVKEFRLLIKPWGLVLQAWGLLLVVIARFLADESYKYDDPRLGTLVIATVASITASWKTTFFSSFSIVTVWLISVEFALLVAPSINRSYWMAVLAIAISLAVAPVFSRPSEYLACCVGVWLIFSRGFPMPTPFGGDTRWSWLLISAVIIVGTFLNASFARIHRQSIAHREKLVDLAFTDALTGIDNRRKFLSDVDEMQRSGDVSAASLLMIDIDNFKRINDDFGHPSGDKVLQQVAIIIRRFAADAPYGRLGGEEFGILLTEGGEARAAEVAGEILAQIRALDVIDRKITASIGISKMNEKQSFFELMKDADDALYEAKGRGKDCFVIF